MQPLTGDLYALTVDASSNDQGLWQDLCGLTSGVCSTPAPTFVNRIDNGALEQGSGSTSIAQGTYNLALAAAPATSGETQLYAGTIDLYRCTLASNTSSCTFRDTTNAVDGCAAPAQVAPAQHALATLAQSSGLPLLFLGNDSGLWRSLDGVAETGPVCSPSDVTHFDNLNAAIGAGGSLAEIVGLAQHPSDANTLLAGMGQNGSGVTSTASALTPWQQMSAGEGGFPLLDPSTPGNWSLAIGAQVNRSLCTLGSACTAANFLPPATVGAPQVSNDAALLDAPALLDPATSTNLITATCRVWRGPVGGDGWSTANAISPSFDGSATPCTSSSAMVRSLAAGGPASSSATSQWSGSRVLYAGIRGVLDGGAGIPGHVFVTTAANAASSATPWTDVTASPVTNSADAFNFAGFDISSLAVDPHDATGATVYATILGFDVPHLYASTDFGAHWTNLSANLPNAPANAVLVDPNDANTVYVALDTGVYVTTAVTSCPTTDCWSPLGTSLPNSPVIALAAGASLPTGDGRVGLLRAGTYGRGIWSTPLLTAAAPSVPSLTVSPLSLTFPATGVNATSAPVSITVTSSGNVAATIGKLSLSGNFAIASGTDTCSSQTLASGTSCSVSVVFVPVVLGAVSGTLSIPSNASGGTVSVSLSGTGVHPATDTLAPTSLTFASQQVNTTSAAQTVTLTNSGDLPLAITSIASSNLQFVESDTCGSSLAAQSSCTLSVTFTPSASGTRTATLTVRDSLRTQTINLSGVGYTPATDTLSATSLSFAAQPLNTSSSALSLTLTNSGDAALSLTSIASSSAEFAQTNTCGVSVPAHGSCSVSVVFTPTVSGTRTASLIITDAIQTQTVTLTGVGYAPATDTLSPASLTFASQQASTTSAAQTVTLTNSGDVALAITSVTASPSVFTLTNHCGSSLAAHSACTFAITFTPSASGVVSGVLNLTDALRSQTLPLSGTGYLPATDTLSTTNIAFASQLVGTTSSPRNVTLTNSGDVALAISGLASSSSDFLQSNTCGNSLPSHSACTITVSFAPITSGARTGNLVLTDANGSQSIALSGLGLAAPGVTLTPASLGFSAVLEGTTSAAQTVTLTNNGGTPLTLSAASTSAGFGIATSTCGGSLAVGAACTYSLTFTPPSGGAYTGSFTITDNAPSSPQVVSLSGSGTTPAALTLSTSTLVFPSTATGSTSPTQAVTLTNPGGLPLTLSGVVISNGFSIASNTCGPTLAAATSCIVSIAFTPSALGAANGTLTIGNSATPSTQTVSLSGTGLAPPTDSLSPPSLTFAAQPTGVSSPGQAVTLTNTGDIALAITAAVTSNSSFLVTDGCGSSLAAHSSCTYGVVFAAATTGSTLGVLSITDALRLQTVSLSGTAYAPATDSLSTASLAFPSEAIGSTGSPQPVILSNNGDVALAITSITTSGPEFGSTGNCGASLAAHSSCTVQVTFTPSSAGLRSGSLIITDAAHTETVSLTGTGYLPATDTLSASSLTFATQPVNTTSSPQTITVTNTGDVALSITSVTSSTPEFAVAGNCGPSLPSRASCTLSITFTPSAVGSRSGVVTLVDSAHTLGITLSGNAAAPASLVFAPIALAYPATIVSQTTATQIITLSNVGGEPATLQTPAISGDFAIANNTCGASLQPNVGCSIAITFTPTAAGLRTGTLSVGSSAGTQTAQMSGNGEAPATDTLAPLALTFALQQIGTASAGQQVTLTNAGDVPLTLISASTSSNEFVAVNDCSTSLVAHATCAVVVSFIPSAVGARSGTLVVADAYRSQTVVLNGTGAAPPGVSLSPSTFAFAPTGVGITSAAQPLTLTNNGGLPLSITSVNLSAGFALLANGCGATLPAGSSCTLQVVSVPLAAGPYSGTLTLVSNATPATQTVSLSSTGIDFALNSSGAVSQTVSSGATANYALQLVSLPSLSGVVSLTCTGAPTDSHCIISPSTGALGATQNITVTVTTGVAALDPPHTLPWLRRGSGALFALGLPWLCMASGRQHRRTRRFLALLLPLAFLGVTGGITGCGAGRALPPGATTTIPYQTPSGSYPLVVTAVAAGVTHTVQLTLLVH